MTQIGSGNAAPKSGSSSLLRWIASWLHVGILVVLIGLCIAANRMSQQYNPIQTQPLDRNVKTYTGTLGISDWVDEAPLKWAANEAKWTASIESRISTLLPDSGEPGYDMISLPLTALSDSETVRRRLLDNGWRIIWVASKSINAEHVLIKPEFKDNRESLATADMIAPSLTFSTILLHQYLKRVHNGSVELLHNPQTGGKIVSGDVPCRADMSKPSKYGTIATHEMCNHTYARQGFVADDSEEDRRQLHLLTILLVKEGTIPKKQNAIVTFLRRLCAQDMKEKVKEDDNKIKRELLDSNLPSYPSLPVRDKDYTMALSSFELLKASHNLQFFYSFGETACEQAVSSASISGDSFHSSARPGAICDMAASKFIDTIATETRLPASDMEGFCKSRSAKASPPEVVDYFKIGESDKFDAPQTVDGVDKLVDNIRARIEKDTGAYCVVGTGDAVGKSDVNIELGEKRARFIAGKMLGKNANLKLYPMSVGNSELIGDNVPGRDPRNRRVIIRKLPVAVKF